MAGAEKDEAKGTLLDRFFWNRSVPWGLGFLVLDLCCARSAFHGPAALDGRPVGDSILTEGDKVEIRGVPGLDGQGEHSPGRE